MTSKVRTRFAPSPTGHLHIGNARTAIMNWIFARRLGGVFVLRIEDTDKVRSTEQSEASILDDLRWLGLGWDEGPDRGGPFGPYRQSERLAVYRSHLDRLVREGKAYPCFCTAQELEARRQEQLGRGDSPRYDGRCRDLTDSARAAYESEGRLPAIRFRIDGQDAGFEDLVKGPIGFPDGSLGDFILARPDGMPMYNFACVVDDRLMEITHVIRGDDHVSNTPRQVLLYRAFCWECPAFAHIPMILGKDRERLSKRHGATSVDQYRDAGYLPEAIVNFLSLLSWSSESGDTILPPERLVREFDFSRVSSSAAVFDVDKLDWMNGAYLRALDAPALAGKALAFFARAGYPVGSVADILPIISLLQSGADTLSSLAEKAGLFFRESVTPEGEEALRLMSSPEARAIGPAFLAKTGGVTDWTSETFQSVMKEVQRETGIKGKALWMPIRVMLTGQVHGPDLAKAAEILGIGKCRRFVEAALK
jgi:nondiscriminating glutamyl-tRNA synthetase